MPFFGREMGNTFLGFQMRLRLSALLSALLLICGCASMSCDLLETASVSKPKFADTDPQDFGMDNPHRHEVHGIDVSKWNGDVDWRTVHKSGISFVFIKATEGADRIDPKFNDHWRSAAATNILHTPCHFYYFCSTANAQADWFIRNVPKEAVTLPPVLDVEWSPASLTCKTRPVPRIVRAEIQRFLDRIEAHYDKRPIIYTSVDFHRDNLVGQFKDYHFWVRSVAVHPAKIYEDRKWAFWQYTATGVVPGVNSPTDINVFAGSEKNWQKWIASTK